MSELTTEGAEVHGGNTLESSLYQKAFTSLRMKVKR